MRFAQTERGSKHNLTGCAFKQNFYDLVQALAVECVHWKPEGGMSLSYISAESGSRSTDPGTAPMILPIKKK